MPKARRIVWAPDARADLLEIWRHQADTASPDTADKVVRVIHTASERLNRVRTPGRPRDELLAALRSVYARPYTVFFRLTDDRIEIVRVLHERRDLLAQFDVDRD